MDLRQSPWCHHSPAVLLDDLRVSAGVAGYTNHPIGLAQDTLLHSWKRHHMNGLHRRKRTTLNRPEERRRETVQTNPQQQVADGDSHAIPLAGGISHMVCSIEGLQVGVGLSTHNSIYRRAPQWGLFTLCSYSVACFVVVIDTSAVAGDN